MQSDISNKGSNKLVEKLLPVGFLINFLLLFRPYYQEIPTLVFIIVIIALFCYKAVSEGNTIAVAGQIVSFLIIITGQSLQLQFIQNLGCFIVPINYMFMTPRIYKLPKYAQLVGLREGIKKLASNYELYWAEWYPVESTTGQLEYTIKWAHTKQVEKMIEYVGLDRNMVLKNVTKYILSSVYRYELSFSKAKQKQVNTLILFSHGRSATPFIYSTILMPLAGKHRILSPQHNEVKATPFSKIEQVKEFRVKQVKERASQVLALTQNFKAEENSSIVLMGHSYGCSTVLESYFTMNLSLQKHVKGLVLLDPWLFPLKDELLECQIRCPILMFVNQKFINLEDIFLRNKKFVEFHNSKIIYVCWKNATHLQQTDMPFLVGNSLGIIKDIKTFERIYPINLQIISKFIEIVENLGQSELERAVWDYQLEINQKYKELILPKNYVPSSMNSRFTF